MTIDPAVVTAILGIAGVGVIGIVETLKRWLKVEGLLAWALAFVVSFGATALVLVQASVFTWLGLVIYGLVVFGEATGLYHVFQRNNY